jgi:hypothetical protein
VLAPKDKPWSVLGSSGWLWVGQHLQAGPGCRHAMITGAWARVALPWRCPSRAGCGARCRSHAPTPQDASYICGAVCAMPGGWCMHPPMQEQT